MRQEWDKVDLSGRDNGKDNLGIDMAICILKEVVIMFLNDLEKTIEGKFYSPYKGNAE